MQVRPLQDRVIVKRLDKETMSKGGILIPDTVKEKPLEARVVAVGKGRVLDDGTVRKPEVKPRDRVLIGKYSGTEVRIDEEDHVILREEDILAVIES